MIPFEKYEAVIGLEVHVQLNTKSKIFAADGTKFDAVPNTQVSPITLGMPGVLPKLNIDVLVKAIKLGLACNCTISDISNFDRKNYFYADLPKGYQISQERNPICKSGSVEIKSNGVKKIISLNRIHMEEDAGKNNHEIDEKYSLVDLNRAGIPLLEIVTEPDIRSADEAYAFLSEIRRIVRYLDICDGNMEEGSIRCDANISIRLKGETKLNSRVEIKNMNSIRNLKRAIENELYRQIQLVENGQIVEQQTRSFIPTNGSSFVMRTKEFAHDYRYFPEPDLPPILISSEMIESIRNSIPYLPKSLFNKLTSEFNLSDYDAHILIEEKEIALYFIEVAKFTENYKSAANWIIGEIKSFLNDNKKYISDFPIDPKSIASIISLIDENKINYNGAKCIFNTLIQYPKKDIMQIIEEMNLSQSSDYDELYSFICQIIKIYPDKIIEYKKGKKGISQFLMGEVMKLTKGKANPKLSNEIIEKLLKKY